MKRLVRGWAAMAAAMAMAGPAAAVEFCVSNAQQLSQAFLAAVVSNQLTEIKLVQGSYILAGTTLDASYDSSDDASVGPLRMKGGYTANCASRTIDPGNTILQGVGLQVPDAAITWDFRGDALFEGLSFLNFSKGFTPRTLEDDVGITFRRNIFRNGSPVDDGYHFVSVYHVHSDGVAFTFENNLFVDNGGQCALAVEALGTGADILGADITLVHNTFADNEGHGLCVTVANPADLYNNVFYGNADTDVRYTSNTLGPLMVRNTYGSYQGPSFVSGSASNSTSNPLFVGAGNYQLQASSPAVNSGSTTTPGGLPGSDIDGGPRVIGTRPDRGAYESAVTDTFVQTVTNANDGGAGSLRQALTNANLDAGFNIIDFAIPGACPHRIDLDTNLPDITDAVLIDGYSQPGSSLNTKEYEDDAVWCVRIDGRNARSHAFRVASGAGAAVELRVQGLGLGSFTNAAVELLGGSNHVIQGNYFGDGLASLDPNRNNIVLGSSSHGTRIGGTDLWQRNVLVAALDDAVRIDGGAVNDIVFGSYDNDILNNFIGVRSSGDGFGANENGVVVRGHDNTIDGNVISANRNDGVQLDGPGAIGNVVKFNVIGRNASGGCPVGQTCNFTLPNERMGVMVQNVAHDNDILDNLVTQSGDDGVRVMSGVRNKIRRNAIYQNGAMSIDLDANGPSPNDNDGAAIPSDLANRLVNTPELTAAQGLEDTGTLYGQLRSTNGTYKLDIYLTPICSASSPQGEATMLLKTITVTITNATPFGNGTALFGTSLINPNPSGNPLNVYSFTATATDDEGNTSELAACVHYVFDDVIFVDGFE